MLAMFVLLVAVASPMFLGRVVTLVDWGEDDGDWTQSTQHHLGCRQAAVNTQHKSLRVDDFISPLQLHFHVDVQVYLITIS